ncbi:MAG TPA: hypothetical protein VGC89_21245, partial [Pyrinomonadaceae bacterium]
GRNADIAVTSVLQTTAGKMIFGRLWEESNDTGGNGADQRANGARRALRDVRPAISPTRITEHGDE